MSSAKSATDMTAVCNAALEDLQNVSAEQLRQEALERGEDIESLAEQVRAELRGAAAQALRGRLRAAKERFRCSPASIAQATQRPSLLAIKQIVQRAFESDPALGLAFRDGSQQSDADWQSLYDDLVRLGVITPDDRAR